MHKIMAALFLILMFGIPFSVRADVYTTMKAIMGDMTQYVDFLEDSLNQEEEDYTAAHYGMLIYHEIE
ncbi:hypothetical protein KAS45_03245 [candidate division WOR-3 bacterium]|nr:hypothetical protein [candidate division WOR-3 bacterium]